jgi:toxin ParE1/3/4
LYKIVWTAKAIGQLEAIGDYIAFEDPPAASRLADRLIALADSLAAFPRRGRLAEGSSRELTTVWPYILRYRVEDDRVLILHIRHGARDPNGAQPESS